MRTLLELGELAVQKAALGVVVDERQRALVGGAGGVGAAEPAEQLAAGRVQVAVVVEIERVDELQAALGTLGLGVSRSSPSKMK